MYAWVSVVGGLAGFAWWFTQDEVGEPQVFLIFPSLVVSIVSLVLGIKAFRRTRPRRDRAVAIVGIVLGGVGTAVSGLYALMFVGMMLVWMGASA